MSCRYVGSTERSVRKRGNPSGVSQARHNVHSRGVRSGRGLNATLRNEQVSDRIREMGRKGGQKAEDSKLIAGFESVQAGEAEREGAR